MTSDWHQRPLWQLTLARLREFVRDPSALFWTFGFPIVLAVALGIAFREAPPQKPRVAVEIHSAEDHALADTLERSERVERVEITTAELDLALASGKIDLVVVGEPAGGVRYRFDPERPESAAAKLVTDDVLQAARGRADIVHTQDEAFTEPGGRYIDFLVPGLVGLNLMGSAIWGIGFAVVDARKRKLLKRLAATPMRRSHFLLSYMLSRLVFLCAEVAALVGFGVLVFDIRVRGSLVDVGVVSVVGALAFTGIAMLIAARPRSTETASGWANLVMLPMWLLSGAFFSYERFPEMLHPIIRALPLTAANDALRAVMNEGAPLWSQWPEITVLSGWGLFAFLVALRAFRWQ